MSRSAEFESEERELHETEKRILRVSGVEQDLTKVTRDRADRQQVLRLLALAVFDHEKNWRSMVRQRRDALKSLARRLRSVAEDAEQLAGDPRCGAQFWLALLGMMKWEEVQWPAKSNPKAPFGSMMRTLAKHAENKATNLGRVLREGALHGRRSATLALSYYIRKTTGHDYDNEVARLLTDAHEAIGLKKNFSAAQIKKARQRHMRPSP